MEVTYYYNYLTSDNWTDSPYMVDGLLTTFAYEARTGVYLFATETTCPGTDLGTITKVELRAYGYGDGNDMIRVDGRDVVLPSSPGWIPYIDVTGDESPWTWIKLETHPINIGHEKSGKSNIIYCAKVEIRVTYTPGAPSSYYRGLKVQGEGELALCDVGNNPLRIRKGGVTYGIELVDTNDPNASRIRIKVGAGIKAIRKYT